MRKVICYIIAFIVFTYLGGQGMDMAAARQIQNAPPYCLSFASIGAIFLESRMDSWAKINATLSDENIELLFKQITDELGLPAKVDWVIEQDSAMRKYKCQYGHEDYEISIIQKASNETLVFVSIISRDPSINILKYQHYLGKLTNYAWKYNYTYCGEIASIFTEDSMEIMTDTMLKNLNADAYEHFHEGDSMSVWANSDRMSGRIPGNSLQIALRKQVSYGKTKVWIGFPKLINGY